MKESEEQARTGIDSVETGMKVLLALSRLGKGSHALGSVAASASIAPGKVHRYLVSLGRTGFVEQDAHRGGYRLGPSSLELGARAIKATDALRLATEAMPALREETNLTTALIIWGTRGPLILWSEESEQIAAVSFKVGRDIPALISASGLCLSAHLPWATVRDAIEREMNANGTGDVLTKLERHRESLGEVRKRGLTRIVGALSPGITTLAAPVLTLSGYAAAAITLSGSKGSFDASYEGAPAAVLVATCRRLSGMLGYSAEADSIKGTSRQ